MRVCLIVWDNGVYIHHTPIGLAYLASAIRNAGHEVVFYNQDMYHWPESHLTTYLTRNEFDVVGLGFVGGSDAYQKALKISEAVNKVSKKPFYVIGGHGPSPEPEYFLKKTGADCVVIGEGDVTIVNLLDSLNKKRSLSEVKGIAYLESGKLVRTAKQPLIPDLDTIPFPAWDLLPMNYYALYQIGNVTERTDRLGLMLSARDCPFHCLAGDTVIDTLDGYFPIKALVGKTGVKVLTRNLSTNEPEYAPAYHIAKYGENQQLVRVHFNDGSHIDCTPDHKFMVFRNGNQFYDNEEWEVEAQNLQPRQSVRAIKYCSHSLYKYVDVTYGRYYRIKQHRLVMEGYFGRRLTKDEDVHHKDKNKANNVISNLELTDIHSHIPRFHPEISLAMKKNNPMRNQVSRAKATATLRKRLDDGSYIPFMSTDRGKTVISHLAYQRAISDANPLLSKNRKIRAQVNHKVVWVEWLKEQQDVYCLQVPGYDWFFANGVLVHNCNFCYRMNEGYRERSSENIVEEIKLLMADYNINFIQFQDELLMSSVGRTEAVCKAIMKLNIRWGCNGRLNYAKPDLLKLMKESGCRFINYGIEAMDDVALRTMNKALTVKQIISGIEATLEAGVHPGYNIIWGNIGETKDVLRKDVEFLLKYDDQGQMRTIRPVTPLPGTPLYEYSIAHGLLEDVADFYEKKHTDTQFLTVNFTNLSEHEYYEALCEANVTLLANYHDKQKERALAGCRQLFEERPSNWKGFRPT